MQLACAEQMSCAIGIICNSASGSHGSQRLNRDHSLQDSEQPHKLDVTLAECLLHLATGGWKRINAALKASIVAVTTMPCSRAKLISMTNAFRALQGLHGKHTCLPGHYTSIQYLNRLL